MRLLPRFSYASLDLDSKKPPEPLDQLLARAAAVGGSQAGDQTGPDGEKVGNSGADSGANVSESAALEFSQDAQDAWRTIIDQFAPRVFGLLVRQCGDRELAEEITQATFVKIVVNLGKYNEQGRFEPWLFRIAMNRLRDEMRRRKRQAKTMDMSSSAGADAGSGGSSGSGRSGRSGGGGGSGSGGSGTGGSQWAAVQDKIIRRSAEENRDDENPLEKISRAEQIERLRAAIATMSEADQEIIHLRHTAGMSFAEIAESLEQPLGTVLARGHRALGKLKSLMMEPDEAESDAKSKVQKSKVEKSKTGSKQ